MKSFFLYEDVKKVSDIDLPGVYDLNNSLVGIDTFVVDKKTRHDYTSKLQLREFHIIQRMFALIIKLAKNYNIRLLNIELSNMDICSDEHKPWLNEIKRIIHDNNDEQLVVLIKYLNEEYECEVRSINFAYKDICFTLTSTGILSIEDNLEAFQYNSLFDTRILMESHG